MVATSGVERVGVVVVERFSMRVVGPVVHELWDLREQGLMLAEIAARTGWSVTAIKTHFREHGGIRPRWGRALAGRSLSFEERQLIMVLKAERVSVRQIAARLGRAPSTISRELARNTNDILGNSKTAQRGIADQQFAGEDWPQLALDAGINLATGQVPTSLLIKKGSGQALKDALKMGIGKNAVARADEIAVPMQ